MSRPIFAGSAGVYSLTWEGPSSVVIHVSRLREDRYGGTSAEVRIESPALDAPHLYLGRLNLLSDTKKKLAKELSERLPADWDTMLEQLAVLVLEREREGQPVVALTPGDAQAATNYLLPPFLPEGEVSVLFSEGGSGKSLLALLFAALVASGQECSLLGLASQAKRPVLYLDFETTPDEHRRRLRRISAPLGLELSTVIHYRSCATPVADDVENIQCIVQEHEIGLLVVDSAGPASGADIYSPDAPIALFRALRRLGTTCLLIAHVAKGNGDGSRKTPFGSVYYFNLARSVWELRASQAPGGGVLRIGLLHQKSNVSGLQQPIGLEFRFDGATGPIVVSAADLGEFPGRCGDLPVGRRIEDLLPQSGPLRPKDIATRLAVTDTSARTALKRLCDSGRVSQLRDGRYAAVNEDRDR